MMAEKRPVQGESMINNCVALKKRIFCGEGQELANQTLRITETIVIEGALTLKNCTVDLSHGRLEVSGTLHMDSCILVNPGQDALHFGTGAYAIVRNTKLLFQGCHKLESPVLYQQNGSWVSLEHCSLENMGEVTCGGESALFHIPYGKVDHCIFRGFRGERFLSAHEILVCTFDSCGQVYCGERAEDGVLADSTFNYCVSVRADDANVKYCRFFQLTEDLWVERSSIEGCLFEDITCGCEALVRIVDSDISHCDFRNIHIEEDSLLVSAIDSGIVEHCTFSCISTTRQEDNELFVGSKLSGCLYKRRGRFDILDEETCTGQDQIRFI